MAKYYLMYHDIKVLDHHIGDEWFLYEKGIDCIKKPNKKDWYILYESDTIPEMLHQIQDRKDWRFYVVNGSLSSKGATREEKYPQHTHICSLAGFIPEVCDIRLQPGKMYFNEKWVVEYEAELWIRPGGYGDNGIFKVQNFKEHMERAVQSYLKENNLEYGMTEEKE